MTCSNKWTISSVVIADTGEQELEEGEVLQVVEEAILSMVVGGFW